MPPLSFKSFLFSSYFTIFALMLKQIHILLISIFIFNTSSICQINSSAIQLSASEAESYSTFRKQFTINSAGTIQNSRPASSCVSNGGQNIGFESGNLSSWDAQHGTIINSLFDSIINIGPSFLTSVITGTNYVDANTLLTYAPVYGNRMVRMNDASGNCDVSFMSTKFVVTPSNNILKTAVSLVFQRANHECAGQPYFRIQLFSCSRSNIIKEYFIMVDENNCGGSNPQFLIAGVPNLYKTSGWRKLCFDLRDHIGEEVELNVIMSDCKYTGHYGYGYFDAEFGFMPPNTLLANTFSINNTSYSYSTNIVPTCFNQGSILQGTQINEILYPVANQLYGSVNSNSVAIMNTLSYALIQTPLQGCEIPKTLSISLQPTVSFVSPPSTVCPSSFNLTTFSVTGSPNYTMKRNGITYNSFVSGGPTWTVSSAMNNFVQNPSTITVVGNGGQGCLDSTSIVVQVYPISTIAAVYSPTVCVGTTTMSTSGAASYTWSGSSMTSYLSTFTPNIGFGTTYFNLNSTDFNGCKNPVTSFTTFGIGSGVISLSGVNTTSNNICQGDSVLVSINGANSHTWSNSYTACCQYLKPTPSNTLFTVIASASCTPTSTFNIPFTILPKPAPNTFTVNYPGGAVCPNTTFSVQGFGYTFQFKYSTITTGANPANIFVTAANPTFTAIAIGANGCKTSSIITMPLLPNPTLAVIGSTSLCPNQTTTLTGTGANTYTWNSATPSNTFATSPSTVNYNVVLTGSNTGGCSSTSTIPIYVESNGIASTPNTTNVCIGSNILTLSAMPFLTGGTYSWSTGPTTPSIVINPTVTTTYTLFTNSNLCGSQIYTITIVVNPNFVTPISTTITPVCQNKTFTITASPGASLYKFHFNSPSASNTYTGSYPITFTTGIAVTATLTNGCVTSTVLSVTVFPNPSVVAVGPPGNAGCKTGTVNAFASGASTYTWSNMATGSVAVISPSVNQTYSVIGTATNGCTGTATTPLITGAFPPTITITPPNHTVCVGSLFSFSASTQGGYNFLWNDNTNASLYTGTVIAPSVITVTASNAYCIGTKTAGVSIYNPITFSLTTNPLCSGISNIITFTASPPNGTVFVNNVPTNAILSSFANTINVVYKYQDTGSCVLSTNTVITINQTPCVKITANTYTDCIGNTITFTGTPVGGLFSGTSSANTLSLTAQGNYSVQYSYTDANGCSNTICTEVYADVCTGVKENKLHLLSIYPNPTKNSVIIENPSGAKLDLKILDLNGRILYSTTVEASSQIDMSNYGRGLYIFYLDDGNERIYKKIIKD